MIQWLEDHCWPGTSHLTEAEVIQCDYELIQQTYPKLSDEEIQQLLPQLDWGLQAHRKALLRAKQHQGETIFDRLTSIIKYHPNVRLILEP